VLLIGEAFIVFSCCTAFRPNRLREAETAQHKRGVVAYLATRTMKDTMLHFYSCRVAAACCQMAGANHWCWVGFARVIYEVSFINQT
jgi:hypothetical protein